MNSHLMPAGREAQGGANSPGAVCIFMAVRTVSHFPHDTGRCGQDVWVQSVLDRHPAGDELRGTVMSLQMRRLAHIGPSGPVTACLGDTPLLLFLT